MKKAVIYCFLIVIIVLKALFPSDIIRIDGGPLYIQNSTGKGVKRYLPNIIIKFRYRDTKGEDFTKIRKTNENGDIIDAELPISEGAQIDGIIKAYYTLIDHTKSVYNDKGDILVTTSIKIEAPSLEKTPQVKIDEFKSISLKDVTGGNVSKADQAKVRVFEYDSDKNYLTGENGNWFLKIEDAVSEMDNTPMNGWGDYSLVKRQLLRLYLDLC